MHDDELCAGLPHNSRQGKNSNKNFVTAPGKDACQGDSGGPLICAINNKAVLVGVVSHGSGCGEAGKPGIYAKVDFFKAWFQSRKPQVNVENIIIFVLSASGTFIYPRHQSSTVIFSD